MATYAPLELVHAHLPAPPTIPNAIPELRVSSDRPFPAHADLCEPLHPDHAVSATHDEATGLVARSIRNGFTLELRRLSPVGTEGALRITFPDRLLPLTSGIVQSDKLYVLAVTDALVVYRLSFARDLTPTRDWCEEYEVDHEVVAANGGVGVYEVVNEDLVLLGAADGGVTRLERSGQRDNAHHRPSKSRLPSLFRSTNEQVVAMATFGQLVYTLSPDRLRTWEGGANVRSTELKSDSPAQQDGQQLYVLRHPSSASRYSHIVIVYRAHSFLVYRATDTDLTLAGGRACPNGVSGAVRGFSLANDAGSWRLQVAWDRAGSLIYETVPMDDILQFTTTYMGNNPSPLLTEWQTAASSTTDLDAAYFDNLLGPDAPDPTRPDDNHDIGYTFISHLFHPNRFSALTLSTALDEYVDSLRGVESITGSLQQRLLAVVGCHVELEISSQTGAPVVDAYRRALKREWLGVWARAKELDRQARWPVAMGKWGEQTFVVTREGVTVPVRQDIAGVIDRFVGSDDAADFRVLPDMALRLYPALKASKSRSSAVAVSSAGVQIGAFLGDALEDLLGNIEVPLSTGLQEPVESLATRMWEDFAVPILSEEDYAALRRSLSECYDVLGGIANILDILLNVETVSDDAPLSDLGTSLTAATVAAHVSARHRLAQNVLLLALFYLSESIDSPSMDEETEETLHLVLARALVVYHRYRVLKWVAEFSVEGNEKGWLVEHLLVHRPTGFLSRGANTFIGASGVVGEELEPSDEDVAFGYSILESGLPIVAGQFAELYSTNPGMAYLCGRAALAVGAVADAVRSFESANTELSILPFTSGPNGAFEYLRHVTALCSDQGAYAAAVYFGQNALRSGGDEALWTQVFLAALRLEQYEDAYSLLARTPYLKLQQDLLSQLVSVMCEANEVGRLNQLGFVGLAKDVERVLSFKAHNSDPLRAPNYYKALYSWHISRGDYRSAGEIMYLQARRLGSTRSKTLSGFEISAMQARSYLAAINALALVEKRNAWLSVPGQAALRPKRRKTTHYVPASAFKQEAISILDLADIRGEYATVLARLRLEKFMPGITDGIPLDPAEIVGMAVQFGQYDLALATAADLDVDMRPIFVALATRAVELGRGSVSAAMTAYLQGPLTLRLKGSPEGLALRYLELALQHHDSARTNFAYRIAVADTLFMLNTDKRKRWRMPAWLVQLEMERDAEGWISRALRWGWVEEGVEWMADLLRKTTPPELLPKRADAASFPYNLVDRVLVAARGGDEKGDKQVQAKAEMLEEAVRARVAGLRKLGKLQAGA